MKTISKPYYAVIFSSVRTGNNDGYEEWDQRLENLVQTMDGYLGHESYNAGEGSSVTISYWRDLEAISKWRNDPVHMQAQELGRQKWYSHFYTRVCKVERDYRFDV